MPWWSPVLVFLACLAVLITFTPDIFSPERYASIIDLFNVFTKQIKSASKFPLNFSENLFGSIETIQNHKWWYVFIWPVISVTPELLITAALGFICLFVHTKKTGTQSIKLMVRRKTWKLSFQQWLWLIVTISFSLIIILRPTLYDSDRHLIFLYPPLFLLAVLGLDWLYENIKIILASIIIISATIIYSQWGTYSYIYLNPLIPNMRISHSFTGDYAGACLSEGISKLTQYFPADTPVQIDGILFMAHYQRRRYKPNKVNKSNKYPILYDSDFEYTLKHPTGPSLRQSAILTSIATRSRYYEKSMEAVRKGEAELVWSRTLPNGEIICALIFFP